jgi:hypothetical protein
MTIEETFEFNERLIASLPSVASTKPQHNRVSPEGKNLGKQLARLCDRQAEQFIVDGEWEKDERCDSCAFRHGTVPNGCLQTQLDALKSVLEHEPFFCHVEQPKGSHVCSGWFASVQAVKNKPKVICPWPYSPPD